MTRNRESLKSISRLCGGCAQEMRSNQSRGHGRPLKIAATCSLVVFSLHFLITRCCYKLATVASRSTSVERRNVVCLWRQKSY